MFHSSSRTAVVIPPHFWISSNHFRTGQRCLSTWCYTFYMLCTLRRNIIANAEERGFVRGTRHSIIPFWVDDASFCSVYEHNTESLLLCWHYLLLFCNNRKRPTQTRKVTLLTFERKRKRGKSSWGFLVLCSVLTDLVLRLWEVVCCMCMCLTVWSRNACTIIGILQFRPHRKHRILVTNTS
jgi:hypothetical protein